MNDFRDLKAIAEVCQQHQPLRFMRSHGALYIRNDNGIVFDVHQNRSFPEFMAQNKDYADLVLAANPATVLALFAENAALVEKYEAARDRKNSITALKIENEQLKAENEALRKDAERYQWMSTEGNWVARFHGKWRAHAGEYGDKQPTDWYPSRDEAIDAAMGKGKQQ
jgi:hypothetical protein